MVLLLKITSADDLSIPLSSLLQHPFHPIKGIITRNEKLQNIALPIFPDVQTAISVFPSAIILDLDSSRFSEPTPAVLQLQGEKAQQVWRWLLSILNATRQYSNAPHSNIEEFHFAESQSPLMQEILDLVHRVAPTPTTVLIRGESGTGKEIIARLIHHLSPMHSKPLVIVNCTALSPQLIESELFGHRKGAFTGAVQDKIGLLEQAHGGTVFLDEIGDMPLEMQAKLLRFLQSGEVRPIGSTTTRRVKVRIIAATNRNLETAIQQGDFREDLFYRLNAFTLQLPPLRKRKEDIPLLAAHFLQLARERINKHVTRISPKAMALLLQYHWPGNLRELKNVIERAVVLATGDEITVNHLPFNFQIADASFTMQTATTQNFFQKNNNSSNNLNIRCSFSY